MLFSAFNMEGSLRAFVELKAVEFPAPRGMTPRSAGAGVVEWRGLWAVRSARFTGGFVAVQQTLPVTTSSLEHSPECDADTST